MPEQWRGSAGFVDTDTGQPIDVNEVERHLLHKLTERGSDPEEALWDLAWFYSLTGRHSEALSYLERINARTDDPERKAAHYLALGQFLEQMQRCESALSYYSGALNVDPLSDRTWYQIRNQLGDCLKQLRRAAQAEATSQPVIGLKPMRYIAYRNLGLALEGRGFYAEAARCYTAAARVDPADPRALNHLAHLLAQHPEVALAIPDIERELRASPTVVKAITEFRVRWFQRQTSTRPPLSKPGGLVRRFLRFFKRNR